MLSLLFLLGWRRFPLCRFLFWHMRAFGRCLPRNNNSQPIRFIVVYKQGRRGERMIDRTCWYARRLANIAQLLRQLPHATTMGHGAANKQLTTQKHLNKIHFWSYYTWHGLISLQTSILLTIRHPSHCNQDCGVGTMEDGSSTVDLDGVSRIVLWSFARSLYSTRAIHVRLEQIRQSESSCEGWCCR